MTEQEIKQKTELEKQNEMLLEKIAELESYLLQKNIAIEELKDAKAQMAQISYNVQVENNKLKKQIPVWNDIKENPIEDKQYLCKVKSALGGLVYYRCLTWNTEYHEWKDVHGELVSDDIIYWSEIKEEHNA